MLVANVLKDFHKIVPFPWSTAKLKKAGVKPTAILLELGSQLQKCRDIETDTGKALLKMLKDLEMLS